MFVQVIEGTVTDPTQVYAALERWSNELAPGAVGWLGTTAGVTKDGTLVAVARFDSLESAQRNSERPEQDQWWSEVSALLTGPATFRETSMVDVDLQGDPDAAGFVQVIHGRTSDPERSRQLMAEAPDDWAAFRPDILGSLSLGYDDGSYTAVMYFTSEADARVGETKAPPPELKEQMAAMEALEVGGPTFRDLNTPWVYSPS